MYYLDKCPQYPVRTETPDPFFARQPQPAIVGIEGESRVRMQYVFQAWDARGPKPKYRDILLHTATEELDGATGTPPAPGRWTAGPSLDGNNPFAVMQNRPLGEEPVPGPARAGSGAETRQIA